MVKALKSVTHTHTHTHTLTHTQTKSESNRKGKQQKDNETKSRCEGKTESCVTADCRDLNMPWNCIKHPIVAKAMLLHNFASLRSAESRMLPVCSTGSGGHYSLHQVFHFPIHMTPSLPRTKLWGLKQFEGMDYFCIEGLQWECDALTPYQALFLEEWFL